MNAEPCGWDVLECDSSLWPEGSEDIRNEVNAAAVFILWSLTGQRYSQCAVTVTPVPSCRCVRRSCGGNCTLYLPGPVSEVLEVIVNGEEYEGWSLAADGTLWSAQPWPADVEVTYLRGFAPPAGHAQAAGELAIEIAKARCNDSSCALPPNITRRIREGDTVEFGKVVSGTTGITTVDMWIDAANRVVPGWSVVSSPDVDPWVIQSAQVSP